MAINLEGIFSEFVSVEKKLDLFSQTTRGGVRYWKLARFPLFVAVATALGQYEAAGSHPGKAKGKIASLRGVSWNSLGFARGTFDTAIIEHARKQMENGRFFDPYTEPVAEERRNEGEKVVFLESGDYGHRDPDRTNRYYYGDSIMERAARAFLSRVGDSMGREAGESSAEALRLLETGLGVPVAFNFRRRVDNFLVQRAFFRTFFKKSECRKAFLVCSYGKEPIIAAARDCGVETIEMQHGVINDIHPGYSFPSKNIPYFPDRIRFFGSKWIFDSIPLAPERCEVYGFPRLNAICSRGKGGRRENSILFVSQPTTGKQLLKCALEVADRCPDLEITFKFHPRDAEETIDAAKSQATRVRFLRDEESIYELFEKASIVVGVYSFALLEASAMGCGLILLRAPGIESIGAFIDDMGVTVADNASQIVALLADKRAAMIPRGDIGGWFFGLPGKDGR